MTIEDDTDIIDEKRRNDVRLSRIKQRQFETAITDICSFLRGVANDVKRKRRK